MKNLRELVSKKQFFVLFNLVSVAALVLTGRLKWSAESLVTSLIALLVINGVVAISARKFPEWR
jgi:hypothetical protein